MKTQANIPVWVLPYCETVRETLSLDEWIITYVFTDKIRGEGDTQGLCNASPEYLHASITFRVDALVEDTRAARELIMHEHLHIALSALTTMLKRLTSDSEALHWSANLHIEQAIVRLSKSLVRIAQ